MVVLCCRAELFLPESRSLKSKRQVLNSLKERIRNKFNVSVSEIGGNDLWQRSEIGIAIVANEVSYANRILSLVVDHIQSDRRVHLLDYIVEAR